MKCHARVNGQECKGVMVPGTAMQETLVGMPDFPGKDVVTFSAGGPGRLVACLKCEKCGHSITMPNRRNHSPQRDRVLIQNVGV